MQCFVDNHTGRDQDNDENHSCRGIILEQIRKLTKKDSEAVMRYAGYQKDKAEREKKGRKRRLKQVT